VLSTRCIKHGFVACVLTLMFALPVPAHALAEAHVQVLSPEDAIAGELERTLWSLTLAAGEKPVNLTSLPAFYQRGNYRPVWCDASGLSSAAQNWLSILGGVEQEGMRGLLMHREEIGQRLGAEGSGGAG